MGAKIPEYREYPRADLLLQSLFAYCDAVNPAAVIAVGLMIDENGHFKGSRLSLVDKRNGEHLVDFVVRGVVAYNGKGPGTLAKTWIDLYYRQFKDSPYVPAMFNRLSEEELREGDFIRLTMTERVLLMGIIADDPTHRKTLARLWSQVLPMVWRMVSRQLFPLYWGGDPRRDARKKMELSPTGSLPMKIYSAVADEDLTEEEAGEVANHGKRL